MTKLNGLKILSVFLLLAGCTEPKTPAQAVFQMEGDYAAALSLEKNYDELPDCSSPSKPLVCSKKETRQLVRKIDDGAWDAISQAQTAVRTAGFGTDKTQTAIATATAAVAAFTNIVQTLGVK